MFNYEIIQSLNDLELLLRIEGNSKSLGIIEESINEIISKIDDKYQI